jgi:hypothetical protein
MEEGNKFKSIGFIATYWSARLFFILATNARQHL